MTELARILSITKDRTADELVAESRVARQAAEGLRRKREELAALEREAARLKTVLVETRAVLKRPRTGWTWPLVLLAGVVAWAGPTDGLGYASTTKAVALAVSLAVSIVAVSGWRWNPYPALRWPAQVVVAIGLLAMGAVVVGFGVGVFAALAWFVVVAALVAVRLRHSWSAFTLARHGLRYQALQAEIAVLKASLAANTGTVGGLS